MYFICTKNTYVLFRYDGTEIHEASACLAALTRGGAEPICYAPDADQAHVINHQKGEEMETGTYNEIPAASFRITLFSTYIYFIFTLFVGRNVLHESARIARGAVKPLSELMTG